MLQGIAEFLENYGALGLFIHSFIDAVIFPIPAFFTQVSLSLIHPANALWLATVGYIACLLGTPIGYLIGKLLGKAVLYRILKTEWIESANRMFQKNGEAAILIGAFTPIPFKVFTILSGFLNFPLWKLIAFAALGRAAKFYVVGGLFYWFGRAAESMVKDVSLYMTITVVPLLVIGLVLKRRYTNKKRKKEEAEQAGYVESAQSASHAGSAESVSHVASAETVSHADFAENAGYHHAENAELNEQSEQAGNTGQSEYTSQSDQGVYSRQADDSLLAQHEMAVETENVQERNETAQSKTEEQVQQDIHENTENVKQTQPIQAITREVAE